MAPLLAASRAAAAMVAAPFAPPRVPLRLTRTVERQLGQSGTLVVARSWSIAFEAAERGFQLSGKQADVAINAPPMLAGLARIEQARVEDGMFPMLLDQAGAIANTGAIRSDQALATAIEMVRARLSAEPLAAGDKALAERFMASLQAAGQGALAAWPHDLFAPGSRAETVSREVRLPDGKVGTLTILTTATCDAASGLMRGYERRIVTEVEGQSRTGAEQFALTAQS